MSKFAYALAALLLCSCTTRTEWRTLPSESVSGVSGVCATDAGDDAADVGPETGADATADAGPDASQDTGVDTGPDAASDATADSSLDSGVFADASVDTGTDTGTDASTVAYIRQVSQVSTPGDNSQDQYSQLPMPVLAGSAVLVFVTEYNINGNPTGSGAPSPVTVTDAQGTYTLLATVNDQSDWQAVISYYRPNVAAGTIDVHAHFAGLEWQGIVVAEIANTTAAPLIAQASSLDNAAQKSANAVKTPSIAVGSTAALIVAFAVNGLDTYGEPSVGTGYTLSLAAWNWGGVEGTATTPSAVLEVETASGSVKGTWTAAGAGDNWLTFVSAWQ